MHDDGALYHDRWLRKQHAVWHQVDDSVVGCAAASLRDPRMSVVDDECDVEVLLAQDPLAMEVVTLEAWRNSTFEFPQAPCITSR